MGCRKENWGREIQGNERVKPAVRGVTFGQTMDTTEMVNEIGSLKAPLQTINTTETAQKYNGIYKKMHLEVISVREEKLDVGRKVGIESRMDNALDSYMKVFGSILTSGKISKVWMTLN